MKKYQKLERVGKDSFGGVFLCRDYETGHIVLVKETELTDASEGVPSTILRKISLLKEMEHPNILRLLDVVICEKTKSISQVFEYAGLNLKTFMRKFPKIVRDQDFIKGLLHQILGCLAHYHSNKSLHGCLTPHHVLIINHKCNKLKLADIGMAVLPCYKAPEILLGSTKYSYAVDVWSLGCIFAELVNQQPLFSGPTEFHEMLSIFRLMGTPNEENWPGVTKIFDTIHCFEKTDAKDLAILFPRLEPAGFDLLSKMLRLNPLARITVDEALKHEYLTDL